MLHRLLPVLLFAAVAGVWYGVSSVVYAYVVITPFEAEVIVTTPTQVSSPREVRLDVVGQEEPAPPASEGAAKEIPRVEYSVQESAEPLGEGEAEALLVELMKETESVATTDKASSPPAQPTTTGTAQDTVFTVPFYSQFADISSTAWQKVGCGIAGLAMLIDFYSDEAVSVDTLLQRGIAAGAYLDSAGWIHSGLIGLSKAYGLGGESRSLAGLSMADAFAELEAELINGPVMASVHYTFEPTNPIPHLVVINGVKDGKVFYNDPAEVSGGGSLSIEKFQRAWKKRYIEIRPI